MQLLSGTDIALTVEFGFNQTQPSSFCDDNVEEGAFRFCINMIACNSVVILVSAALIFIDLLRACYTNKQVRMYAYVK